MTSDKLQPFHRERKAIVYLRQSSQHQLVNNRESTQRQYALADRAADLGWPPQRVEVVDEDLGRSGTGTAWRTGFQLLAKEVAEGRVGAVLALEVSRFARSSTDWHQLLDLCGWASTVIVDEQAVYDPRDPNDRLLLGLKGQMSEAERYWMRLRLQGGKLSKARRGELRLHAPIGYVWDASSSRLEMDPDERVRDAIALVFERFRIDGSAHAVLRYLVRHALDLPHRPLGGAVSWGRPRSGAIERLLHSPIHAGAYVLGRTESRPVVADGRLLGVRQVRTPTEAWKVCIHERHPGYISWDEYMSNQERLDQNRAHFQVPLRRGAARDGAALLQGIVLCGRCGARMQVNYKGRFQTARYTCPSHGRYGEASVCWTIGAAAIDSAVVDRFLAVAIPPEVELSLAVAREAEGQAKDLERQWRHRLDQAGYEARIAERRYMAVDPDNRTVARTLERLWEEKLREKEAVEAAYERARQARKVDLGPADQARILDIARDLRKVWDAPSTTDDQRKNLLRVLIQEVAVSPVGDPRRATHIEILWETGAVERFDIPHRPGVYRLPAAAKAAIETLMREGLPDDEVARALNERGIASVTDRAWDARLVFQMRRRANLPRLGAEALPPIGPRIRADGLYSARAVAERFNVPLRMIEKWQARGLLRPAEGGGGIAQRKWFHLDQATIEQIERGKDAPTPKREKEPHQRDDGLFSTRGVANRLGVAPHVVQVWTAAGLLDPVEGGGKGKSLWFRLDEDTIERLTPLVERCRARARKLHREVSSS